MMADHGASFAIIGPVAAGRIGRRAVGVGPGQDIVTVRAVAPAIHRVTIFRQPGFLADRVGVAVQRIEVFGDQLTIDVVPWSVADPIAGVGIARAEISAPSLTAGASCVGQLLTMGIGTFEASQIGAVSRPLARDEAHLGILSDNRAADREQSDERKSCCRPFHQAPSPRNARCWQSIAQPSSMQPKEQTIAAHQPTPCKKSSLGEPAAQVRPLVRK